MSLTDHAGDLTAATDSPSHTWPGMRLMWPAAAAAVIVLAGLIAVMSLRSHGPAQSTHPIGGAGSSPVAVVTGSSGVICNGDPLEAGQSIGHRRISIEKGSMELAFMGGATVRLSGQSEIDILDLNVIVLHRGRVWTRLTSHNSHFQVTGPNFSVVDEGTEFGIDVQPGRDSAVQVFDGVVRAVLSSSAT